MIDRIEAWHSEIDTNTSLFEEKFKDLTIEKLNWKPNSKNWSIGQVIEHLKISNEGYFGIPKLLKSRDFKPSFLSKIGFMPKMFGNFILKAVDPNNHRKVKTMKVFEPAESNVGENILNEFKDSQLELHKFIDENIESIKIRTVIPSPVNKHIVYYFDDVIDILINHQKRHFNQASNVSEMIINLDI